MDTPEHDECLSAQGDSVGVDEQPRKYAEELEEEASCKKKKVEIVIRTHTHTHIYAYSAGCSLSVLQGVGMWSCLALQCCAAEMWREDGTVIARGMFSTR